MAKPYDNSFKLLSDDDPRATLALFAGIPLSAKVEAVPVERELNLPAYRIDNLYRCEEAGSKFLAHVEAVSRYKRRVLHTQKQYVRTIVTKFELPVRSYLALLTSKGVPKEFPEFLEDCYGDYESRIRLRVYPATESTDTG